jgi:hypothetical protein
LFVLEGYSYRATLCDEDIIIARLCLRCTEQKQAQAQNFQQKSVLLGSLFAYLKANGAIDEIASLPNWNIMPASAWADAGKVGLYLVE